MSEEELIGGIPIYSVETVHHVHPVIINLLENLEVFTRHFNITHNPLSPKNDIRKELKELWEKLKTEGNFVLTKKDQDEIDTFIDYILTYI